jgi:hypothetical protein
MSNVIPLRPHAPARVVPDDSLRADCEKLMRRLVRSQCAFEHELRQLADLLDVMIERVERET